MGPRRIRRFALSFLLLPLLVLSAYADPINLLTAGSYAVLGGSTVTNTGSSVLTGNLGVGPGCAITGFPPGIVHGTTNACNAATVQAQIDLTNAFNTAMKLSPTATLTGVDLGGQNLKSGVYFFASSAQLTGQLTLNNNGNRNAVFVFQIGSTLTTASSSSVIFTNGFDKNVFWVVGSSATLGTSTKFVGHILALDSITLNNGASITCGSALARTGAVTLNNNVINTGCRAGTTTPEPGTIGMMFGGLAIVVGVARRRMRI
jgi:ice-binding like protein/PEP-CTERM motif-containing protein